MKKYKLLLVDDMDWVYEVAKLKLSRSYDISYVNTERKALNMIEKNNYDFVVADYYLGTKSPKGGLNVVRVARNKGLKAILMSKENHKKEILKEGVEFVFKKDLFKYLKQKAK